MSVVTETGPALPSCTFPVPLRLSWPSSLPAKATPPTLPSNATVPEAVTVREKPWASCNVTVPVNVTLPPASATVFISTTLPL